MTKVVNIDENSNSENEKDTEIVLTLDAVKKDVLKINSNVGLFKIQSANEWINQAGKKPIQKMLCDVLWFENELCILFADTNIGKSILAVQIGESIASGKPISSRSLTIIPRGPKRSGGLCRTTLGAVRRIATRARAPSGFS